MKGLLLYGALNVGAYAVAWLLATRRKSPKLKMPTAILFDMDGVLADVSQSYVVNFCSVQ